MSGFEFGLIPIAIVVGFAITRILSAWGTVVRQWSSLKSPWLFLSFTGFAMGGMVSHFVGDWAYRDIELHLGRLILIVLPTLPMVIAVSVIVPNENDWPADLREHYFGNVGKAAALFGIGVVLSVLPDLLPGASGIPEVWMVAVFLAPLVFMVVTTHPVVHRVAHVVCWLMLLLQMSGLTSFGAIE
jgi:hypothetical protein